MREDLERFLLNRIIMVVKARDLAQGHEYQQLVERDDATIRAEVRANEGSTRLR